MDVSIIVFATVIVCGIFGVPLMINSIHKLLKECLKYQEKKENEKHEEKIENVKEELKKVTESGTLEDLINVSKKLGDNSK